MPPAPSASPPVEEGGTYEVEEWDSVDANAAPPAQVAAAHSPGGGKGAPATEEGGPTEQGPATGGAAQIRLYLARHNIYQPWYPMVGEIGVDPAGVAIVGTSLAADEAGSSRKVCAAVVRSGFVAGAMVLYGKDLSHACR